MAPDLREDFRILPVQTRMNRSQILAGSAALLLTSLFPAEAGEHSVSTVTTTTEKKAKRAPDSVTTLEYRTPGYHVSHQITGELTLDRAVDIALAQNPNIVTSLQEIQRTRGEIIEVRAAALPQITLSGAYEVQDTRLLKGGGETPAQNSGSPLSGTTVGTQSAVGSTGTVSSPTNTTITQAGTPIGSSAPGSGSTSGAAGSGTGTTTTGAVAAAALNSAPPSGGGGGLNRPDRQPISSPSTIGTTGTTSGTGTGTNGNSGSSSNSGASLNQILKEIRNSSSSPVQDQSWNVTIEVRQVLYAGGQIQAAIRIAQFAQDTAYFQLRDTIDQIIATVRSQFYDVLLNRSLITVQEESVRLLEQQLQDQQNRFEAGTVPRFNVLQAEVALANQRPLLIQARNNYLLAQIQLAKTLGSDPGPGGKPGFVCVGDLTVPQRHINLPDSLMLARARRPSLKVQRLAILSSAEEIKVELAGYKPQLNAHAGYELRNRNASNEISDTVNGWFLGVTGSWAVFDGFATYGRVKQARSRLEESKSNYEDAEHEVDLEVETAFANLQQAQETIASQQENVREALEAVRLAQERLNAGAGVQLDVLNSQVQLTSARTTELQARANYAISVAEFDRATATDTVYRERFKDPLNVVQKSIFGRLAETGLPKLPPKDDYQDEKSH